VLLRVWGKQEHKLANWSDLREPMDMTLAGERSEAAIIYVKSL